MADLKIKIKGDTKGLDNSINKAKSGFASMKASIASLATGPAGLAIAGITVAVTAMASAAKMTFNVLDGMAEKLDGVAKSAKRAGVTGEEFQFLSFAARRSGASAEAVEKSIRRMNKVVLDAGRGLKTAKDIIEALGLSFKQLNTLDAEQRFRLISERISLVANEANKAAIAGEIFGSRSGAALLPMIADIRELDAEWKNLNATISNDAIKASEEYEDAWENLGVQFKSLLANSGALRLLADVFQGIDLSVRDIRKNLEEMSKLELVGSLARFAVDPAGLFDGKKEREIFTAEDFQKELKKARELRDAKKKVEAGVAGLLSKDKMPLQQLGALSRDRALSVGQMLTPVAGLGTDQSLSELQKQTAELRAMNEALRGASDEQRFNFWMNEVDNLFKDGA